jgi:putative ABC transport system permease protein
MNWSAILQFLSTDVPTQGLIWAIFAFGVFITYRILNVADMSVDTLFPFAAIMSLLMINSGLNPVLSLLLSVFLGMAVGFINAALHIYCKIDPLLAGIIIMIGLYTPNVIISKGNLALYDGYWTIFTGLNTLIGNTIISKLIILAVSVLSLGFALYWFFGTELGLSLRASGKNQLMARAQGINTNKMYILGMVVSAALISFSGALYGQMTKHITPDAGKGSIVIGLAIIFLGEVLLGKKIFQTFACFGCFRGLNILANLRYYH